MNTPFFEMYRAGLRSTADALEAQARALRELADAGSLDEAMAVQTRRASEQLQHTMDLWGGLWRAAGNPQRAFTDPVSAATASLERVRNGAVELADSAHTEQRAA